MKMSEILNNEQQLKQKKFQWVNYVDEELVFFNEKQNKNSRNRGVMQYGKSKR